MTFHQLYSFYIIFIKKKKLKSYKKNMKLMYTKTFQRQHFQKMNFTKGNFKIAQKQ